MVRKQRTWHGTDVSKVTSLFENGLLVRYLSKEKIWQCVYKSGDNKYSYGWIQEIALTEIFTKEWGQRHLEAFMNNCCSYWDEWVKFPMLNRIDDFIAYFGSLELFGEDYSGGCSVKEICKRLRIKYEPDYEKS